MSQQQKRKPFDNSMEDDGDNSAQNVANGDNNNYSKRNRAGSTVGSIAQWNTTQQQPQTSAGRNRAQTAASIASNAQAAYQNINLTRMSQQNELQAQKLQILNQMNTLSPTQKNERDQLQAQINQIDQQLSVLASGFN